MRNLPDVAAEANLDNYYCAKGECPDNYVVGGTSLAAPRWAGFLALANQQANGTPIGFLNPTIYAIGQGSEYGNDFHDITDGNNFNSGSPDLFSAVTGYDLVTGWGTPNGQSLLTALSGVPTGPNFALAASPSALNLAQGTDGTSTITVSAVNGFSGTVDFKVTALGQPSGVTASLKSTVGRRVRRFDIDRFHDLLHSRANFPIVVTGTSGGLTQTAYVTLTVSLSGDGAPGELVRPWFKFRQSAHEHDERSPGGDRHQHRHGQPHHLDGHDGRYECQRLCQERRHLHGSHGHAQRHLHGQRDVHAVRDGEP